MISRKSDQLGDALRWALETAVDPAMAAANWLARDIDPSCRNVVELLTGDGHGLDRLSAAKDAFKTMRIVGETSADRRIGARLYAAAIAAAIVHHDQRISRQSDAAVRRGLDGLINDRTIPEPLRALAGTALCRMESAEEAPR